uniref:HMA domain-containing protein n=1 Tax=Leersia perrieri TaxID=77586 RepID=A0A0D9V446_9ORYZ
MKIVLKVPITCKKCKTCILRIVSGTPGIKSVAFDDEKSTLTVIGEVDVVVIVDKLRHPNKGKKKKGKKGKKEKKAEGYMVEVMTVSDEKKEAEEKKKKEEEEKKKKEKEKEEEEKKKKQCAEIKQCAELKQCCKACQPYYIIDEPGGPCAIL